MQSGLAKNRYSVVLGLESNELSSGKSDPFSYASAARFWDCNRSP